MDRFKLAKTLKQDEGFKPHAYKDSLGYLTIGYGRMIDERLGGYLSEEEAGFLLENDIIRVENDLDKDLPWWRSMPENAQQALANMCFQLGIVRLKKFKTTLGFLKQKEYNKAADSALDSLWAKQTPNRAKRVTDLMKTTS